MTEKYIRLDDVMTIIARKHLFKDKTDFDKCVHAIAEQIKALPTVEPQEKIGHWEKIKSGDKAFPESIVCSRCGGENSYFDFGIGTEPIGKSFVKSKYCPNCGAKMDKGEK